MIDGERGRDVRSAEPTSPARSGAGGNGLEAWPPEEPRHRGGHQRDEAFVALLRADDSSAFGLLFDAWIDPVFDRISHRGFTTPDVCELSTDTFASVHRRLIGQETTDPFRVVLLRTARQETAAAADRRVDLRLPVGPYAEDRLVRGADATSLGTDPAVASLMWQAADVLGEQAREVLDLHHRHGLSAVEIAAVLNQQADGIEDVLRKLPAALSAVVKAMVVWRQGSPAHDELATAMADQEGFDTASVRTIAEHQRGCEPCREAGKLQVDAVEVFAAIPLSVTPVGFKEIVIERLDGRGLPVAGSVSHRPGPLGSRPNRSVDGIDEPGARDDDNRVAGVVGVAGLAGLTGMGGAAALTGSGAGDTDAPVADPGVAGAAAELSTAPHPATPRTPASASSAFVGATSRTGPAGTDQDAASTAAGASTIATGGTSGPSGLSTVAAAAGLTGAAGVAGAAAAAATAGTDAPTTGIGSSLGTSTSTLVAGVGAGSSAPTTSRSTGAPTGSGDDRPVPLAGAGDDEAAAGGRRWLLAGIAAVVVIILVAGFVLTRGGDSPSKDLTAGPSSSTTTRALSSSTTVAPSTASTATGETAPPDTTLPADSTVPATTRVPSTVIIPGTTAPVNSTTTVAPFPQVSLSFKMVNPSKGSGWDATLNNAPRLEWSVSANQPVTVTVKGPGFTSGDAAGGAAVCPVSLTDGKFCGADSGTYAYTLTVTDQLGRVVRTETRPLEVR